MVEGYSFGAPVARCGDMLPSHGVSPQASLPPYSLTASTNTYKLGDVINITLQSSETTLKGYIIAAKDNATRKLVMGRFTDAANGITLNCGTSGAGAVTHQNGQLKSSQLFKWEPIADTTEPIVFIATVVETEPSFWMGITTEVVTPEIPVSPLPPTNVTTTIGTTTNVQSGSLPTDSECGATKGCFIDCTGNSCNYIVTWRDNGDAVDFELSAKLQDTNNKWIAIGFSSDLKMGDDEVITCILFGNNTSVLRSFNDGKGNVPVANPVEGLSNYIVTVQDGIFRCSFRKNKRLTRQKRQTSRSLFVDLDNDFNVMYGTGPASSGSRVSIHIENPVVTPGKVDFQSFAVIGDTAKHPLVKVHACLMIIAWIFCTGIAIIAARHYKPVWSKSSWFNQKIWFQIHRTLMVTAMTLTVIAFITIFVEVGGYSEVYARPGKEYLPAHPVLGIIVTILCILNPIMSLFRPGPTDRKRAIFNWAHWGVGMVAQILAIITIIFGVELQKSTAPRYTVWVVVGFVIYYVIMEITQKVVDKLFNSQIDKAEDATGEMTLTQRSSYIVSLPKLDDKEKKIIKVTLLKKSLLALHVVCSLSFTLALLILVSLY
ncbi:putative ferric-chelate reductase 1 homolog [Mytilus trossulus]|uniref:putative ferric-chelate reductase 1 homolog n=1 Tax=Mytilus trossulus TaxID=6551 RepID=UPI003003B6C8